ncbi:MAG: DUF5668 domain-containing protein [Bacteroidota bacterium]
MEPFPETPVKKQRRHDKPIVFGGLVLLFGVALLLKNTNLINEQTWSFLFSWEMLIIAIGALNLFDKNRGFGLVMILVGSFFLINNHFDLPFNLSQIFWPVLLIVAGVFLILGASRFKHFKSNYTDQKVDDFFDDVAIFGGMDRTIHSDNFRGGKVVAIFGGSKLNMNHVTLSPGMNLIEMVCVFGGTQLMIPADWNVKLEVISIFGGLADKRPPVPVDMSKTLVIKGVVIFGGGDIKSY